MTHWECELCGEKLDLGIAKCPVCCPETRLAAEILRRLQSELPKLVAEALDGISCEDRRNNPDAWKRDGRRTE